MIEKFIENKKKARWLLKINSNNNNINDNIERNHSVNIFKILLMNFFSPKNLLIYLAYSIYLFSFINYTSQYYPANLIYNNDKNIGYVDLYNFAIEQKLSRSMEIFSIYLYGIYSMKYLQYIEKIRTLFRAFKKSSLEFFFILCMITIFLIGLSILTNFVYGSNIYEYRNFAESLIMNIKIFIFVENSTITTYFMNYFRLYSIIILILFVFLIKYFSLNLFMPILVEYYRGEFENTEKVNENGKVIENEEEGDDDDDFTFSQSNFIFIFYFFLIIRNAFIILAFFF